MISETEAIAQLTTICDQFMLTGDPNMLDFGRLEGQLKSVLLQIVPPAVQEAHSKLLMDMAQRINARA